MIIVRTTSEPHGQFKRCPLLDVLEKSSISLLIDDGGLAKPIQMLFPLHDKVPGHAAVVSAAKSDFSSFQVHAISWQTASPLT